MNITKEILKEKILLFIPCYNCENQIKRVLNQLDINVFKFISEVIVVDNISQDKTELVAREFAEFNPNLPIKILKNEDNYNLGGSHKVAFKYAQDKGFDYIIVLHGDDQATIQDLLPILENGTFKNYDCCLGSRFKKGSKLSGYSKFRTLGNIVFNKIFSLSLGTKIYDLGSGLNLYKVEILQNNFYFKFPDALTFNYCMIMATHLYKQKIMFFPISWREDDQRSNVKMMSQALTTISMLSRYVLFGKKFLESDFRTTKIDDYITNPVNIVYKYSEI